MTPQEYCNTKALREGSNLYYSTHFLPPEHRDAIVALHALFHELHSITYECQDPVVVRAKFGWWQDEIERLFKNTPNHPVTRALLEPVKTYQIEETALQNILKYKLNNVETLRYPTFLQLENYCRQTSGTLGLLCAQVYGYQHTDTVEYALILGVALHLTHLLRNLRRDVLQGRIYFPQSEMNRFDVSEREMLTCQMTDGIQALLAYQSSRICSFFHTALRYLPPEERYAQRSGVIQAQLALAVLQEIANDRYQLFQQRVSLTPLRKVWISWRAYLQIKHGWKSPPPASP